MPPTNDTHRHAKKASPGRRKAKPKFEIPVDEPGASETVTGWVYRADEVPEPPTPPHVETKQEGVNPLLVAGMGMFFLSIGTVGLMSLATLSMMTVPMRFARNIWPE